MPTLCRYHRGLNSLRAVCVSWGRPRRAVRRRGFRFLRYGSRKRALRFLRPSKFQQVRQPSRRFSSRQRDYPAQSEAYDVRSELKQLLPLVDALDLADCYGAQDLSTVVNGVNIECGKVLTASQGPSPFKDVVAGLSSSLDLFAAGRDYRAADRQELSQLLSAALEKVLSLLHERGIFSIEASVGDPFNPAYHEAIHAEPGPVAEALIWKVFQRGFRTRDSIIRWAKVGVTTPLRSNPYAWY